MECHCCSTVVAFQSRETGLIYCCGSGCLGAGPKPSSSSIPLTNGISEKPTMNKTAKISSTMSAMSTMQVKEERVANRVENVRKQEFVKKPSSIVSPSMMVLGSPSSSEPSEPGTPKKNIFGVVPTKTKVATETPVEARPRAVVNGNFPRTTRPSPSEDVTDHSESAKPKMPSALEREVKSAPAPVEKIVEAPKRLAKLKWSEIPVINNLVNHAKVRVVYAWKMTQYLVVSSKDENEVYNCQTTLEKLMSTKKKLLGRAPEINEIVIAKYDDAYFRALVTKVTADKCHVMFFDFGDSGDRGFDELYEMFDEMLEVIYLRFMH